jgi:hypothetical protein
MVIYQREPGSISPISGRTHPPVTRTLSAADGAVWVLSTPATSRQLNAEWP